MLQRIAAITATVGALVLGLHEGDCTAAAVMVMLFAPGLFKKIARPHGGGTGKQKIKTIHMITHNRKFVK